MEVERCEGRILDAVSTIKNHNTSFILTHLNESIRYDFEIMNHKEAILHTKAELCPKEVIEEFLFYSGFISQIKTVNGEFIYHQPPKNVMKQPLDCIQPSQLYVNEEKLKRLLTWINDPRDIIVPVIQLNEQYVSIDGHTRLKAAELLGFHEIYIYLDDFEVYIEDFVHFCQNEQKYSIYDLSIISDEEYQIKWCTFCEAYFKERTL